MTATKGTAEKINQPAAASPGIIIAETALRLRQLLEQDLNGLTVERLIVGVFFVGIKLSNGSGGVAYTPPEMIDRASHHILKEQTTRFKGLPVADILADRICSPFAEIIRLATMNALSVALFRSGRYAVAYDADLSALQSLYAGRRVCLVGAIIPLLKKMKEIMPTSVAIIDKKDATKQEADAGWGTFYPPELLPEQLSQCQTAIFTGAAVANGSIEELLGYTPPDAAIAVVGPSAGFIPDAMFARNVAMVGTSVVTEADAALEILGEGGGGYHLFGTCMRKLNVFNRERLRQLGLDNS